MCDDAPTSAGWFWWTPPHRSSPLMAYLTTRPAEEGLMATLLREDPGTWRKVSEMKGRWGGPCSTQEVEEETSVLKMRWTPPPEDDFPLFI